MNLFLNKVFDNAENIPELLATLQTYTWITCYKFWKLTAAKYCLGFV
jgi:hypothetical protein